MVKDGVPPLLDLVRTEILLVRHDASNGVFFPTNVGLNHNEESEDPHSEVLFSRMGIFENENGDLLRGAGNKFHFKLCYPGEATCLVLVVLLYRSTYRSIGIQHLL